MKKYIRSARSSSEYVPRGSKSTNRKGANDPKYSRWQLDEIQEGQKNGVDVSIYADPKYDWMQMREIRRGLESGVDVGLYTDLKYDYGQMKAIRLGLENGVDVSLYADPKYDWDQMEQIRYGLENGVDVGIYADPQYSGSQMKQIRYGLENGVDASLYADLKYDYGQMYQIRLGLESGVDVSVYADPEYDWVQMKAIRDGLENGVDISVYADPEQYDGYQLEQIREGLERGVDVSVYADPKYNYRQMREIREGLEKYANDPDIETATVDEILDAYKKNSPTLARAKMSKYEKAKDSWSKIKQAAQSRQPLDVPALEEEFNLMPLEGRAANTLGITFDENEDGSITFTSNAGGDLGTISSKEYDMLVRNAIANSSTRSSFAKAFATQLKHTFNL